MLSPGALVAAAVAPPGAAQRSRPEGAEEVAHELASACSLPALGARPRPPQPVSRGNAPFGPVAAARGLGTALSGRASGRLQLMRVWGKVAELPRHHSVRRVMDSRTGMWYFRGCTETGTGVVGISGNCIREFP